MNVLSRLDEELLIGFGEVIDRIVSSTIGTGPIIRYGRNGPFLMRYSWMKVYDETRQRYGRPLTLLAAEALKRSVGEGDCVIIITNSQEMDGPAGAAALARALVVGLRAVPIIVTEHGENAKYQRTSIRTLFDTCIGAELIPVAEPEELRGNIHTPCTVLIRGWPAMSTATAGEAAEKLLDEFNPKAVITVEVMSCNKKGVRHGALGDSSSSGDPEEKMIRWNEILDSANRRKILTIATGDNGNECGFGTIEDILKRHHKFCADCGCPCGAGIVSASKADIVIPATSSNWACYGIEACLAKILNKPEVMHTEYTENRTLVNCANAGIPDGATAMCTPTIDGASHEACIYVVGMLRQTVLMSSVEIIRESR